MLDRLPSFINPIAFSERKVTLTGKLEISKLSRLKDSLLRDVGEVKVSLDFEKEGRLSIIQGKIVTEIILECQSCLGEICLPMERCFSLAIANSQAELDRLPDHYDPLLIDSDQMLLAELIEDEILLELPDYPRHDYDCLKNDHDRADKEKIQSENPFSVLAKLKNSGE